MPIDSDYPLSLFRQALASVAGRTLSFFVTCWVALGAVGLAFLFVDGFRDVPQFSVEEFLFDLVHVPFAWVGIVAGGVYQFWGILSYMILAALFVLFVREEYPAHRMLPAAFFLQGLEFLRFCLQLEVSTTKLIVLALWIALCVAWLVYVIRARRPRPLLE